MRIFGRKVSIRIKVEDPKKEQPYKINGDIQRRIFGSYSQYLEDIFIDSLFRGKATGTYVDIGANDPSELSNTKRFYDRGWSGVNVEPIIALYNKICQARPRDINLNLGIGRQTGDLTFYELSPDTLSTFNKKSAFHSIEKEGAKIISEATVKVMSLADLFSTTVSQKQVDFLSLDAEGFEYEILSSNDWKTYRPIAIIAELNQDKECSILKLLNSKDYTLAYYNGTNGIFVDRNASDLKSIMQS